MKARIRLVQFWTDAETTDHSRLDSEILVLRKRVWERAVYEIRRDERNAKLLTAGVIMLIAAACGGYLWILAR